MKKYVRDKDSLENTIGLMASLLGDAVIDFKNPEKMENSKTIGVDVLDRLLKFYKAAFDKAYVPPEGFCEMPSEEITSEVLTDLLEMWENSLDWDLLEKEDLYTWSVMQKCAKEIQDTAVLLETYSEVSVAETPSPKGKKVAKISNSPMSSKEASALVEEFLNGPWIKRLIVQRPGLAKRGAPVSSYGVYDISRNKAAVSLDDEKSYHYASRAHVISSWFAAEIRNYTQHLKGSEDSSESPEDNYFLSDLLAGFMPDSDGSTETDWAEALWCSVTFKGTSIPGVALRIDPLIFSEGEIQNFAKQLRTLKKLYEDNEDICKTPNSIKYSKTIEVKFKEREKVDLDDNRFDTYDLGLVNIDRPAADLVDQIRKVLKKPAKERPNLVSALFYGVPGSGKSQLANYIGSELGLPVIKKTYADLQSMYVGEGEKQLKKAFEEAQAQGAILLIDEIDSIAGNRKDADKNYQKTFVNQLLTELDNFKGIFVATSNFMDGLDPAVLRRLFLKIKFDFMTKDQVQSCADLYFPTLKRSKIGDIPYLTPGDFKAVKEASLFETKKITISRLRELLEQEVTLKKETLGEVIKAEKTVGYDF